MFQHELVEARFWLKVDKRGAKDCWLWSASRNKAGYGYFGINRKVWKAHRVAWVLCRGAIPDGLFVLHKCDVTYCVNPAHLFLGTHQDNATDRKTKGRTRTGDRRGVKNTSSRLTEGQVLAIRSAPGTMREVAERYGVCAQQVHRIKRLKNWAHI